MQKKINIKKRDYLMFFVNILILVTMLLFRYYFISIGYYFVLINIILAINILFLILGIIFNILFIVKENFLSEKKSIIVISLLLILYIFVNTLGIYLLNKPFKKGYAKISEQLSSYCELYECEQYETVNNGSFKEFILKKQYFDYNGVQNNIEIITKYDYKSIVSVTAFIYSEKEMFSENLIKEQLKGYFDNFNCKLSEEKIKEAFDNRFIGKITNDNLTYQVIEIYDNNQLQKIKTKITLSLR